ncbi:dTMP kinase [Sulfuriroseicoccus oceanibius]|uniref:Thymidylate kinase n=1 Tax=Sulfuriroseicoccus oceanibius TaxID=2707525 RepID=A0A6B3LBZ0_9BACT|nr:dTMP kinase [Sulfuriroseicoccus oceanibius]QQL45137.1 dTMP kinase [Sulfuriroseicoccus oceanibius]
MSQPGFFLSLEGSEGCGKSTQLQRIKAYLESRSIEPVMVREPGGTALGEKIRHLLQHDEAGDGMAAEAELLLFAASRAQMMREVVGPALDAGRVVIADRFIDSTTVYQGVARGLSVEMIQRVNAIATGGRVPDVTLLLDLDVATGRERSSSRGDAPDRMERESDAFFESVRNGYLDLAQAEPERIVVIDAAQDIDTVHQAIVAVLEEHL